MKIRDFCKLFLRKAAFKPELADSHTQDNSRIGISHEFISKALTTMSLHTISVIQFGDRHCCRESIHGSAGIASHIREDRMSSFSTVRLPPLPLISEKATDPGVSSGNSQNPVLSDEILLAKIASGELDSLSDLFRRYARTVLSIGRRILRDSAEAEDLVQEVFLYVHRKSRLFDLSKGHARSWLMQVAYTQALLRRRALNSHGFYASVVTDRPAETDTPSVQGANHEYTVEGFFGRSGWKKVWNSLTEYQRETLRLHFYEGCTFAEIAERLGQSYVNVRHHYYRGLEKLRNHAYENDLSWP